MVIKGEKVMEKGEGREGRRERRADKAISDSG